MRNQSGALQFLGSFNDELPELSVPEIAFAGRSNVGKSSALNCLLRSKKAARVSSTPGRTQMINLFKVGTACTFADLPGYGFAKVPDEVRRSWKSMIEGYLGNRSQLKLVVLLVDIRRDPVRLDGDLLEGLRAAEIPFLVVATKSDKLKKQQKAKYLSAIRKEFRLPPNQPIPFSSVNGAGRDQVWDEIEAAANKG
jgi:GTP-binding protein